MTNNKQYETKNYDQLIQAISHSYHDIGAINYLDKNNLPSRQTVSKLVNELKSLLFPGYFDSEGIELSSIQSFIEKKIRIILDLLSKTISQSLRWKESKQHNEVDLCLIDQKSQEIAEGLMAYIPTCRALLKKDAEAIYEGDPAATSEPEVILCYPGFQAITVYRLAHFLIKHHVPLLPRIMTEILHSETGIDIHPGAKIGHHFFIDHGTGIVIGETAQIGDHVKIYQGVTIGALSVSKDQQEKKRHPTIEDHVTIYARTTILGGKTTIGTQSIIGGNLWIISSVPPGSKLYQTSKIKDKEKT